jgi:hypothetical protein
MRLGVNRLRQDRAKQNGKHAKIQEPIFHDFSSSGDETWIAEALQAKQMPRSAGKKYAATN